MNIDKDTATAGGRILLPMHFQDFEGHPPRNLRKKSIKKSCSQILIQIERESMYKLFKVSRSKIE